MQHVKREACQPRTWMTDLREKSGLTLVAAARQAEVSTRLLEELESGVSITTYRCAYDIAQVYGMTRAQEDSIGGIGLPVDGRKKRQKKSLSDVVYINKAAIRSIKPKTGEKLQDFEKRIGVSLTTLYRMQNVKGNQQSVKIASLEKIAAATGRPIEDFIDAG